MAKITKIGARNHSLMIKSHMTKTHVGNWERTDYLRTHRVLRTQSPTKTTKYLFGGKIPLHLFTSEPHL